MPSKIDFRTCTQVQRSAVIYFALNEQTAAENKSAVIYSALNQRSAVICSHWNITGDFLLVSPFFFHNLENTSLHPLKIYPLPSVSPFHMETSGQTLLLKTRPRFWEKCWNGLSCFDMWPSFWNTNQQWSENNRSLEYILYRSHIMIHS